MVYGAINGPGIRHRRLMMHGKQKASTSPSPGVCTDTPTNKKEHSTHCNNCTNKTATVRKKKQQQQHHQLMTTTTTATKVATPVAMAAATNRGLPYESAPITAEFMTLFGTPQAECIHKCRGLNKRFISKSRIDHQTRIYPPRKPEPCYTK